MSGQLHAPASLTPEPIIIVIQYSGLLGSSILKMEAARPSETLVPTYITI
jgi:hypothetical protein